MSWFPDKTRVKSPVKIRFIIRLYAVIALSHFMSERPAFAKGNEDLFRMAEIAERAGNDEEFKKAAMAEEDCAGFAEIARLLFSKKPELFGHPISKFKEATQTEIEKVVSSNGPNPLNLKHHYSNDSKAMVFQFEYGKVGKGSNRALNELIDLAESKGGEVRVLRQEEVLPGLHHRHGKSYVRWVDGKPIVALEPEVELKSLQKFAHEVETGTSSVAVKAVPKVQKTAELSYKEKLNRATVQARDQIQAENMDVFSEGYVHELTHRKVMLVKAYHNTFKGADYYLNVLGPIDETIDEAIDSILERNRNLFKRLQSLDPKSNEYKRLSRMMGRNPYDADVVLGEMGIDPHHELRAVFESRFRSVGPAKKASARALIAKMPEDKVVKKQAEKLVEKPEEKPVVAAVARLEPDPVVPVTPIEVAKDPKFIKPPEPRQLSSDASAIGSEHYIQDLVAPHLKAKSVAEMDQGLELAFKASLQRFDMNGSNPGWAQFRFQHPYEKEFLAKQMGIPNSGELRTLFEERYPIMRAKLKDEKNILNKLYLRYSVETSPVKTTNINEVIRAQRSIITNMDLDWTSLYSKKYIGQMLKLNLKIIQDAIVAGGRSGGVFTKELESAMDQTLHLAFDKSYERFSLAPEFLSKLNSGSMGYVRAKQLVFQNPFEKRFIAREMGIPEKGDLHDLFDRRFDLQVQKKSELQAVEQEIGRRQKSFSETSPSELKVLAKLMNDSTFYGKQMVKKRMIDSISPHYLETLYRRHILNLEKYQSKFKPLGAGSFYPEVISGMDKMLEGAMKESRLRFDRMPELMAKLPRSHPDFNRYLKLSISDPFDANFLAKELGIPNSGDLNTLFYQRAEYLRSQQGSLSKISQEIKKRTASSGQAPEEIAKLLSRDSQSETEIVYEKVTPKNSRFVFAEDYVDQLTRKNLKLIEINGDAELMNKTIELGMRANSQRFFAAGDLLGNYGKGTERWNYLNKLRFQNPLDKTFLAEQMKIPAQGKLRDQFEEVYPKVLARFDQTKQIEKKLRYRKTNQEKYAAQRDLEKEEQSQPRAPTESTIGYRSMDPASYPGRRAKVRGGPNPAMSPGSP